MTTRKLVVFMAALLGSCASSSAQPGAAHPGADMPSSPPAAPSQEPPRVQVDVSYYHGIVAAPDRSAEDRKLDEGRKPAELLAFYGIAPGQNVAELLAAGGYTTELLARAVGSSGSVIGQNSPFILERFAEKPWTERLKLPAMKKVQRVDRDLDDPLPKDTHDLDAVLMVLVYHDTVWMGVDRDRMNRAVFAALKPGGIYGIVDHASRPGAGLADVQTLHRIEESVVREEVERAGFKLAASADFLKNPNDTYDWSTSPRVAGERRGTSDRFVLKFVKP
jgi:predicted methyltransferase